MKPILGWWCLDCNVGQLDVNKEALEYASGNSHYRHNVKINLDVKFACLFCKQPYVHKTTCCSHETAEI